MGSLKLQSFEDFANGAAKLANAKLEEEQSAARTAAADQFKHLLGEFGVTSIKELSDANRHTFYQKLGASEISESVAIIEEGTRAQIGKIKKNGKITSVYMHYDGYPDHMLPTIKKGYKDGKAVDLLLKKGGGSGLEADPSNIKFYGDKTTLDGDMKNTDQYVRDAGEKAGAEFIYLYSERDKKWYMVDIYDSYDLVPAFESMIINEAFKPSKGNVKDAKKVNKALEKFFMDHPALAAPGVILGVCKYMMAESLTDANFHSYRDPVSKAIKGKITTVMVELDSLGGMSVPVGKKSIINLLDDKGAFMANAAGWSGIGIVEGMALFLDGFGHGDTAQKIVDAFELIWANESVMNEGNAFLAARAKAIEEDAEDFEFNGKKFPVIKEEVEEPVTEKLARGLKPLLTLGSTITKKVGEDALLDLSDKFDRIDDEYAGTIASWLDMAIELMQDGYGRSATEKLKQFNKACKDVLAGKEIGSAFESKSESVVTEASFDSEELYSEIEKDRKTKMISDIEDGSILFYHKDVAKGKAEVNVNGFTGDITIEFGTGPYDSGEWYGDQVSNMKDIDKQIKSYIKAEKSGEFEAMEESVVNEAEVTSDEEFKEYAFTVLKKAFGDKFDEEKAQEVVDGLLSKHGDEYGAAVGALTSSLG